MLGTPEIALRLLLAAVLGAVIGFDRERHTWAAGLRTHMLVCLGAALAMIVSAFAFTDILTRWPRVVLDPSRIAAQVVSGIGFLGAGTIIFMHRQNVIRGLTTAAGLWTVAAIGLAVGGGMYLAAIIATAVAWVILAVLKPLERRFSGRKAPLQVRMHFRGRASLGAIDQVLTGRGIPSGTIVVRHVEGDGDEVSMEFAAGPARAEVAALVDALHGLEGVESVTLGVTPPGG